VDSKKREQVICDIINELQRWEKNGLNWLNKMWRENHGWQSANGTIYELAKELARYRKLID